MFGATAKILLARISETQFLVRVNVSDFRGAIALGFVSNIAGLSTFESAIRGKVGGRGATDNAERSKGTAVDPASTQVLRPAPPDAATPPPRPGAEPLETKKPAG